MDSGRFRGYTDKEGEKKTLILSLFSIDHGPGLCNSNIHLKRT